MVKTATVLSAVPAAMRVGSDRDLAFLLSLAAKLQRGETGSITGQELAALKRIEKLQQETACGLLAANLPKKDWVEWSGRPHKVLADQADRYGIPLVGKTISVKAVARWIHDFLAEHGPRLRNGNGDAEFDPLMVGGNSPALERYRVAQAVYRELQVGEKRGELMSREAVHAMHVQLAEVLRSAGEQIKRQFGDGAHEILAGAIESFERGMVAGCKGDSGRMKDEG